MKRGEDSLKCRFLVAFKEGTTPGNISKNNRDLNSKGERLIDEFFHSPG